MHPGRSTRVTMLWLFALCTAVYSSNGQFIPSGDTRPASLIPFSILLDGTTSLDRFFETEAGGADGLSRMARPERGRFYYLGVHHGRIYSNYPVTTPVLVTPLYAPLAWGRAWTTSELLTVAPYAEKLTAALIAALSVALMYNLLASLTTPRRALVLAVAFAFGTSTWTTSSQALWQHGPGVLFIILTLIALNRDRNALWLAGFAAGMATACRLSNFALLAAVFAVVVYRERSMRSGLKIVVPAALVGLPLILYNLMIYGDVRGGYAIVHQAFRAFLPVSLPGVLISPSRGLLVFAPFLVAGFGGMYLVLRSRSLRDSPVYAVAALFALSQIVFFGWWQMWWGGWSYGPRMLTEATAALIVLSVPALDAIRGRRWMTRVFGLLVAYSIGVQALGALAYSGPGWNGTPVSVDADPRRLWDWRDTQLTRTSQHLVSGDWLKGCRTFLEFVSIRCQR
jgi:hypothetical protein